MPRYHALNTAVNLCVWDPQPDSDSKADGSEGMDSATADSLAAIMKKYAPPPPKQKDKSGPATGYVVQYLREEYFEGKEGVDFLGPAMPYYLVKAGKELFNSAEEDEVTTPSPALKDLTPAKAASTVLAKEVEDTPRSAADTTLSSRGDAEFFTPEARSFNTPEQRKPEEPDKHQENAVQYQGRGLKPSQSSHVSRSAVAFPKPIAIKLDLSQKSFMNSINTGQRQELCITIFYNGEFTHSRLIRANTFSSESGPVENEKIQSYSGRRINTSIEVPWIINPRPPNLEAKCLGFDERWNKINQLLLAEADEWGYYGQFRSPMGEYLEELSKRAVPNLKESERLRGSRAGIIDVVITLGRSVSTARSGLREPRRKLHEDHCGNTKQLVVAPEELRPTKRAKLVAQFNRETPQNSVQQSLNKTQRPKVKSTAAIAQSTHITQRSTVGPSTKKGRAVTKERDNGKRPANTVTHNSSPRKKHATPSMLDQHNDGSSAPVPLFADVPDGNHAAAIGFQSLSKIERPDSAKTPNSMRRRASLPIPSSSPITHQHLDLPRIIPQTRYKGAEPSEDPPRKRRRLDNDLKALGCLPLNFDEPTASSSRLTRAASNPALSATFPDALSDRAVKEGQSLQHFKSTNDADKPTAHVRQRRDAEIAELPLMENSMLSTSTNFKCRSQNMDFGLDRPTDEPRRSSRPRSSTGSVRSRTSYSRCEIEPAVETLASLTNLSSHSNKLTASTDVIRIVFDVRDQGAFSAFVDRTKFEELQLQGPATTAHSSSSSIQKSARQDSASSQQEGGPLSAISTYDGSSDRPSRKGPPMGVKTPLSRQSKSKITKEEAKSTPPLSEAPTETELRGQTVPIAGSGENTMSDAEPDTADGGSGAGKTMYLKPAPYRKEQKSSKTGEATRKASNAASEQSDLVEPPSTVQRMSTRNSVSSAKQSLSTPEGPVKAESAAKGQSKPRTGSSSSAKQANSTTKSSAKPKAGAKARTSSSMSTTKQANSALDGPSRSTATAKEQVNPRSCSVPSRKKAIAAPEGSKTSEATPKLQSRAKRGSVSFRELNKLLTPHKGSTKLDSSFGSSFKEAVADVRETRSTYASPEIPEDIMNSAEASTSGTIDTPSLQVGSATTSHKTSSYRKTPFFNRLAAADDIDGLQADHATGELLREAVQIERSEATPSRSKPRDRAISKAPKEQSWPTTSIKYYTTQPGNRKDDDSPEAKPFEFRAAPAAPENDDHVPAHVTPSGRQGRSYTVDSEGRKVPTSKDCSLPEATNSSSIQAEDTTQRPEMQQSAQPSSKERRSSLSQMMPETPTSTASRRGMPGVFPQKRLPTIKYKQQNGETSTTTGATKVSTPSARPKVSVSDTINFTTPARASASSAAIETPTTRSKAKTKENADDISPPQSKAKTKRKADDMSTASDEGSRSSRAWRTWKSDWKPTSLCDGSVLQYASGEPLPGMELDTTSNRVYRTCRQEREGVFRASGVLMGVRFVVGL